MTAPHTATGRPAERGVALLAVLLAVTLLSLATLVPLRNLQQQAQREREAELLFAGQQYRQALASYERTSPAGAPRQPARLEDLLDDRRSPTPLRHLRRLYRDPFAGADTATGGWELLREQGLIVGIASRSQRQPLKRAGFGAGDEGFADARSHAEWRFLPPSINVAAQPPGATPPLPEQPPAAPAPPPAPPPPDDRRSDCLRSYSQALNRCHLDPAGSAACREQARQAMRRCLGG